MQSIHFLNNQRNNKGHYLFSDKTFIHKNEGFMTPV